MGLTEFEWAWAVQLGADHGPSDRVLRWTYLTGVAGVVPVPAYRVVTDQDGWFQVVARRVLTERDQAVLDGDVQCRLQAGVFGNAAGVDPFADVRHGAFVGRWPEDADRQQRAFVCPECLAVSPDPDDVASRYCGRCHRFTGDPEDPTAGSPLARAVAEMEEWTWGAGPGEGTVSGVRPHSEQTAEQAKARRQFAVDDLQRHPPVFPDVVPLAEQPVIPGEST